MNLPFVFEGTIPASKSVLLRWLVVASYGGPLTIVGDSRCDDVRVARRALAALEENRPLDLGEGAFGFRAIALRASRRPGTHVLQLGARLAQRPHGPLVSLLRALGVQVTVEDRTWRLVSVGWRIPASALAVDGSFSSQFASALAVNGWDLPAPLLFRAPTPVSEGYFALTRAQLASVGLGLEAAGDGWRIPAAVSVPRAVVHAEPDMSSAFAVAALAAVAGRAKLLGLTEHALIHSRQPDRRFPALLRRLGARVGADTQGLLVEQSGPIVPLDENLGDAPDLFPVLAALLALAPGRSCLFGAPQLRAKESDRIAAVAKLLAGVGVRTEPRDDGLVLHGQMPALLPRRPFVADPDQDHRLVMAAAVLRAAGLPIEIAGTPVVAKSFPEFADLISAWV